MGGSISGILDLRPLVLHRSYKGSVRPVLGKASAATSWIMMPPALLITYDPWMFVVILFRNVPFTVKYCFALSADDLGSKMS